MDTLETLKENVINHFRETCSKEKAVTISVKESEMYWYVNHVPHSPVYTRTDSQMDKYICFMWS